MFFGIRKNRVHEVMIDGRNIQERIIRILQDRDIGREGRIPVLFHLFGIEFDFSTRRLSTVLRNRLCRLLS